MGLTGRLQGNSYNYILASFTLRCQDGQKEGIRKEKGPKGDLQCLCSVQSVANPGVQGSFQHDRPGTYLEDMIKEATGDINFTTFLTLFGEKLHGTDPEDVILNAFKCFDPEGTKVIPGEELKRLLTAMGERFTKEEVEEMFNEQECDDAGNFDYVEFTRLIKHGPREEE